MKTEEVKYAKGVKLEKSTFDKDGGMIYFKVPKDCDLVILAGNRGGGYTPYRCLLPHQVYLKDIERAFSEEKFEVIYVIPVSSKAPFPIVFNGEYGRSRWENK